MKNGELVLVDLMCLYSTCVGLLIKLVKVECGMLLFRRPEKEKLSINCF